jgi:hypothetical protein
MEKRTELSPHDTDGGGIGNACIYYWKHHRETVGSVLVIPVGIGIGGWDGDSALSSIRRPLLS